MELRTSLVTLAALLLAACGGRSSLAGPDVDTTGGGGAGGATGTTTSTTTTTTSTPTPTGCDFPWLAVLGGSGQATASSVQMNESGRVLVAGTFSGELDLGTGAPLQSEGGSDYFLVAYDACGNLEWARRFGNAGSAESYGGWAALGADGSAVFAGTFDGDLDLTTATLPGAGGSDAALLRLDPDGNLQWAIRLGDAAEQYTDRVLLAPDGRIHLAGHFAGQLGAAGLASSQQYDIFVLELAPDGEVQWGYQLGTEVSAGIHAMAYDRDGSVLAGVAFLGKLPIAGQDPAKEIDSVLLKLDQGEASVLLRCTGEGAKYLTAIAVEPDDGTIIVGADFQKQITGEIGPYPFNGETNDGKYSAFLAYWNPDYDEVGHGNSQASGDDHVTGLAAIGKRRAFLSGWFEESFSVAPEVADSHGGADAAFARMEDYFLATELTAIGDAADQKATAIAATSTGAVALIGHFDGAIDLGFAAAQATGGDDVFIVRYPGGP